APPNILFYSSQTTQLSIGADIRLYGYYLVPNAEVRVVSRGIIIDGGIYAKRITFEPDVKITVNGFGGRTNQLITTFIPLRTGKPVYSLSLITHRGIMQTTMQDVIIKKDNTTIASASTGENTPFNLWLSLLVKIFKVGTTNRIKLLYNRGSGFYQLIDTIIQSPDTLSGIAFDYKKEDAFVQVSANLDNISISCSADTCPNVIITSQPLSQYVYEGESATFSCNAEAGYATPQYQWYRDGVAIPWATLSSYTLPNVTISDSSSFFFCKVYGPCGEAVTDTAYLIVYRCTYPTFSAQPLNDTVDLDSPAVFRAVAQGSGIAYQWLRNSEPIRDADDSIYIIPSVKSYNNRDLYSVKITNRCGLSTVSREALLVIRDVTPCKIIKQPSGDTLIEGDYYHTVVGVSCINGEVRWYKNGQILNGVNGTSLTIGPVTLNDNGSEFFCIVTNGITADTSKKVYLTVKTLSSYGGSIAISGELYNYNKEKVGSEEGEWFDFMVKLYSFKKGGEALYIEKFNVKNGRGVFVKNGEFTVTLGRGEATTNLQLSLIHISEPTR
ncbi:MAG: immunoglobulin domain-containing protein, partial [Chitinispirillaceae bacterium]|nr:immunoglobulin domain-containing protein [Chitinispirillaceae bacterium]